MNLGAKKKLELLPPTSCTKSDNFLRREPVELAVVESQDRAQHFARVLPKERRR